LSPLYNNLNPPPLFAAGTAFANGFQDGRGSKMNLAAYQFPHKKALLSISARGLWRRRFIFQQRAGTTYYRNAAFNDLHKKAAVPIYSSKFSQAIINWRTISPFKKRALNSRASKLGKRCSGYNYFIQLWMKDHADIALYFP